MSKICFLSGVGIQELILLAIFFVFVIGIPVLLIMVIARLLRKRNAVKNQTNTNIHQTPILKHADKLKELKSLLDKGIISTDEFDSEKKKILQSEA